MICLTSLFQAKLGLSDGTTQAARTLKDRSNPDRFRPCSRGSLVGTRHWLEYINPRSGDQSVSETRAHTKPLTRRLPMTLHHGDSLKPYPRLALTVDQAAHLPPHPRHRYGGLMNVDSLAHGLYRRCQGWYVAPGGIGLGSARTRAIVICNYICAYVISAQSADIMHADLL